MDTLDRMLHTVLVRQEEGLLTKEECNRLEAFVERGLGVLAFTSEGAVEPATQEVQETRRDNGSSRTHPLDVEDVNRETSTLIDIAGCDDASDKARFRDYAASSHVSS